MFGHFPATGFRSVGENQRVEFDITLGRRGPRVKNFRPF